MEQLNRAFINKNKDDNSNITANSLKEYPIKAIQFGEGNFLRGFVDWMLNELNKNDMFLGSVAVVQPIESGIAHILEEQDGLYTLLMRGIENGKVKEEKELISVVSKALNPYNSWNEFLELSKLDELRFIISNTTEAGISYNKEEYTPGVCQISFPAKVTSMLLERFNAFDGSKDKGLVFLPCELIESNGKNLKKLVLQYASEWKLSDDFVLWVENSNYFLSTLVDRIVPGYPREEVEELTSKLGYKDNLLDTCEVFHLWVIEGPKEIAKELPFDKIGLNVIWTDDMTPYRTQKVRMLNGAHTSSVLAAYLGGLTSVREMLEDNDFGKFIKKAVLDEIIPALPNPNKESESYAKSVLERFENPFIKHELISISLNSFSKWKVRVLPSLLDYLEKKQELPKALTFSMAALIAFYNGKNINEKGFCGTRNNEDYLIKDDANVIEFMGKQWSNYSKDKDVSNLVNSVLSNSEFWGKDLTSISNFADTVSKNLQEIVSNGARAAVKTII